MKCVFWEVGTGILNAISMSSPVHRRQACDAAIPTALCALELPSGGGSDQDDDDGDDDDNDSEQPIQSV